MSALAFIGKCGGMKGISCRKWVLLLKEMGFLRKKEEIFDKKGIKQRKNDMPRKE